MSNGRLFLSKNTFIKIFTKRVIPIFLPECGQMRVVHRRFLQNVDKKCSVFPKMSNKAVFVLFFRGKTGENVDKYPVFDCGKRQKFGVCVWITGKSWKTQRQNGGKIRIKSRFIHKQTFFSTREKVIHKRAVGIVSRNKCINPCGLCIKGECLFTVSVRCGSARKPLKWNFRARCL